MYDHYLSLGGAELLSTTRALGYTRTGDCPIWWLDEEPCETLADALGDLAYERSLIQGAPWYDPDLPDLSSRFLGASYVSVDGLEDSTREGTVIERNGNGGRVVGNREASRRIRVRAMLTADGKDALSYGLTWLRNTLSPGSCAVHGDACGRASLEFFATCPPERGTKRIYGDWEDQVVNLLTNPSFEAAESDVIVRFNNHRDPAATATAEWNVLAGTGGAAAGSVVPVGGALETTAYRVTWSTSASAGGGWRSTPRAMVDAPDVSRVFSVYVLSSIDQTLRATIEWLDGSNATTKTDNGDAVAVPAGIWTRLSVVSAAPVTASPNFAVSVQRAPSAGVAWPVGATLDSTAVLVERSVKVDPYFSGSTTAVEDSDTVVQWLGTPNASGSRMVADTVVGASPSGLAGTYAFRSQRWAKSGSYSLRLYSNLGAAAAARIGSPGELNFGMTPGEQYTLKATLHLEQVQAAPSASARRLAVYITAGGVDSVIESDAAPNAVGDHDVELTFTLPADTTSAYVQLIGGDAATEAWWDDALLAAGDYEGPYFDGSSEWPTPPDGIPEALERYVWTDGVDSSPSAYQVRTTSIVPYDDDEYRALQVDPLRYFLHDVSCISGPLIERRFPSKDGRHWGMIVEYTLLAETPQIFTMPRSIDLGVTDPFIIQDVPYNLATHPSAELSDSTLSSIPTLVEVGRNYVPNPSVETNATGWTVTPPASTPNGTFTSGRSNDLAAAGAWSMRARIVGSGAASPVYGNTVTFWIDTPWVRLADLPVRSRPSFTCWVEDALIAGLPESSYVADIMVRAEWSGVNGVGGAAVFATTELEQEDSTWVARSVDIPDVPGWTADTVRISVRVEVVYASASGGSAAANTDMRVYVDAVGVTVP